jgi:hypothetical protein
MFDANIIYAIANETGVPVTTNGDFYADLDSAINDAKQNNGTTLYSMIKNGFSVLYKNKYTETIKRVLMTQIIDIRTQYYATNDGVIITNIHDNLKSLLNELYGRNYTPVYMSIHNAFKICVDTYNANTDETSFEPIEHLELKIYDSLLKE